MEGWVGLTGATVPVEPPLRLDVGCRFRHSLGAPVPAVVQVEPRPDGPHRVVEESWELARPLGPARRALMRLFIGVRDRPSSLTAGAAETLARMRRIYDADARA